MTESENLKITITEQLKQCKDLELLYLIEALLRKTT